MMIHTAIHEEGAKKVRTILKSKKLEDSIKIIVGGAPYKFDPDLYKKVEADGWSENAIKAVSDISKLIEEVKK